MNVLGINSAFHDSSSAMVLNGVTMAAVEEERFTRIKHGKRPVPFLSYALPFHAVDWCLAHGGMELADVEHVAYAFDPGLFLKDRHPEIHLPLEPSAEAVPPGWESPWEPLMASYVTNAPRFLLSDVPHHLRRRWSNGAGTPGFQWHFVPHHLSHAASAFLPSPFEDAAVMVLDGRGETSGTSFWVGRGKELESLGEIPLPDSLGLLYERVTEHLGFLRSSDEYKVMALASFGNPSYKKAFEQILKLGPPPSYKVDDRQLEKWLGPPRRPGELLGERHADVAHSLQSALEDAVMSLARWLAETSGKRHLCLAGGVALNCVLNGKLRESGLFDDIWVQPAAGDSGTALGAALWISSRLEGKRPEPMEHAYLGPESSPEEIEATLRRSGQPYRKAKHLTGEVASHLYDGRVVGWFQGRMEFGPRALGSRSILASPTDPRMQSRLNEIKGREDFRPVAPVVAEECASAWFEVGRPSPYMLFVHRVRPDRIQRIPAVKHVDGTARLQTVNERQNPGLYELLKEFGKRSDVPMLVNTSFNTAGRPIVCTPEDALECFWSSPIDVLAIGPFLVEKPGGLS